MLQEYTQNCAIDTESIDRLGEFWVSYVNSTDGSGIIVHPHCPYDNCHPPTTLVQVSLESPRGADTQCASHRTGTLCGGCQDGYSLVLGSSRCKRCSNRTLALLIPLLLAGVILVALVLLLHLTVDVGSINGLILYANIVTINQWVLFPEPTTSYYSSMILAWVNLDLGIETCFFNGMNMYSRTWLDFLFSMYLLLLAGLVIVLKHRLNHYYVSRLLQNTNPAAAMATVLLLVHAKFLRLINTIVSYTALTYPSHMENVWLVDANLPYLSSQHLALFVLAIVLSSSLQQSYQANAL